MSKVPWALDKLPNSRPQYSVYQLANQFWQILWHVGGEAAWFSQSFPNRFIDRIWICPVDSNYSTAVCMELWIRLGHCLFLPVEHFGRGCSNTTLHPQREPFRSCVWTGNLLLAILLTVSFWLLEIMSRCLPSVRTRDCCSFVRSFFKCLCHRCFLLVLLSQWSQKNVILAVSQYVKSHAVISHCIHATKYKYLGYQVLGRFQSLNYLCPMPLLLLQSTLLFYGTELSK